MRAEAVGTLVLAAALTVLLAVKARFEEQALLAKFPDYALYCARTRRFWPVGPHPAPEKIPSMTGVRQNGDNRRVALIPLGVYDKAT